MKALSREDLLEVVGCEIERRPDAPGIDQIAAVLLRFERDGDALNVTFPAGAREDVEAFAAAERQCCGGIDWAVSSGARVNLRINGSRAAIDVIEALLAGQSNIEKHQ